MYLIGNKNKADIFRVKKVGSALIVKNLDGTTTSTTVTNKSIRLNESQDFAPSLVAGAKMNCVWNQRKDDKEFLALFNAVIKPSTSSVSSLPAYTYSDGIKFDESSSNSSEMLLVINYGGTDEDGDIKVTAMLGNPSDDFGSWLESSTAFSSPKIGVNGIAAEYALDVADFLDATIVTVPSTFIIEATNCFKVAFVEPTA